MNAPDPIRTRPRWFRTGLFTLLLAVLVIAVFYGSWAGFQRWYIATHPLEIAWSKMHTTIRNGDTIGDLELHLGRAQVMTSDEVPDWLLHNARRWPDGYRDGDQLCRWEIENNILHFQFRGGQLINHKPAEYADPETFFAGVE